MGCCCCSCQGALPVLPGAIRCECKEAYLVAPFEGPGAVAHVKGVRALPHAAAGAKLVADAVARLRHDRGCALPICGLPKHHLRSRALVSQHSLQQLAPTW